MIARLVPIDNSLGIRIPKAVLQQCGMSETVELVVKGRQLIIRPARESPRENWREAAARMAVAGDDELLIPDVFEDDAE